MHKLALGVFAALVVACGSGSDSKVHIVTDSGSGSDATCNPLAQTGCNSGEKCTWIYDLVSADGTNVLGHVGCAPEGDKAVGAQCTRNPAGAEGYDDCTKVGFCKAKRELVGPGGTGVCEQICDNQGGDPMCGDQAACVGYHNIFDVSDMIVAGVCDVKCDPVADNDPLHGSNAPSRPGTRCQAYEGCYGNPGTTRPTSFSCAREYNTDLQHRSECTDTSGNSMSNANPLGRVGCATASNGCAQGYMPLLIETTGSMVAVCIAMCEPASCYQGHCGTNTNAQNSNMNGKEGGRQCSQANLGGTVVPTNPASPTNPGREQCTFNWFFEIDSSSMLHYSPYDDTIGWCFDHSGYAYFDSNGDGTVDATDSLQRPRCDQLPKPGFGSGSATGPTTMKICDGTNDCVEAADFGCTTTTEAGIGSGSSFESSTVVKLRHRMSVHPAYGAKTAL